MITFCALFYKLSDTICAVIARYLLASRSRYGRLIRWHKHIRRHPYQKEITSEHPAPVFFCGTTAQFGLRPLPYWDFYNATIHTHTQHKSTERLIRSSYRRLRMQYTTNTTDENVCPQRDSNLWPQQSAEHRPRPQKAQKPRLTILPPSGLPTIFYSFRSEFPGVL